MSGALTKRSDNGVLSRLMVGRLQGGGGQRLAGRDLFPQARLTGPMPWVIAIMVALTAIALAGGLSLGNAVSAARAEIDGGVTVQVLEPRPEIRDAQARAATRQLEHMAHVTGLRLVPQAETDALIAPWLGTGASDEDGVSVPVPALIDVRLDAAATPSRVALIARALHDVAPAARVDAQSDWLKPVFRAMQSLRLLAAALIVLLACALAAAVLLASRSALGASREVIEIVHLLGATDRQVAGVFQRATATDAGAGGALGLALAVAVILGLGQRFAGLGAGLVDYGALVWSDWVLIVLVPVLATLLAMVTARMTVLHALRKML
ncbi:cell division protein [Novosphingobium sp. 9]|uniref:cell division protein FtsX n=1 Tax=Novosphingobium sp. 9 TaxID=2025349 RepID=UPI0028CBBA7B|nr:cell division protein [Novosphingobium sp. 9]